MLTMRIIIDKVISLVDKDYQLEETKMKKYILMMTALLCLVVLTACGGKKEATPQEEEVDKEEPKAEVVEKLEVTDALGNTISFDKAPETFAVMSAGDMDMLLAVDAKIVGRPNARGPVADSLKDVQEIGNPHEPNFEQIAAVGADVLIVSPSFERHAANIEKQGTKVIYTEANSIQDIQDTLTFFGKLAGNEDKATEINDKITAQMKAIEETADAGVKTILVYGAPGTYLAALPNSLSGDLLAKAGGENIASDFPKEEKYPNYASLSVEKIIERNPQAVMLITHGEPEAVREAFEKEMAQNAAWKNLDAVKNGKVTILPSDLFGTNPGTHIVDALEEMQKQLEAVK